MFHCICAWAIYKQENVDVFSSIYISSVPTELQRKTHAFLRSFRVKLPKKRLFWDRTIKISPSVQKLCYFSKGKATECLISSES